MGEDGIVVEQCLHLSTTRSPSTSTPYSGVLHAVGEAQVERRPEGWSLRLESASWLVVLLLSTSAVSLLGGPRRRWSAVSGDLPLHDRGLASSFHHS